MCMYVVKHNELVILYTSVYSIIYLLTVCIDACI